MRIGTDEATTSEIAVTKYAVAQVASIEGAVPKIDFRKASILRHEPRE
jgi:hypothetical protein